jgi:putative nucleotidyltransferase with HDIG domain
MKKRILFVDDERRVLEGLEDLLVRYRHKWEMVFAVGGAEALEQLQQMPFDVIVTDMRMPGMDGATLLGLVNEKHPGTVRVVLSGHFEMEAATRTVPVAHQFLHKPCDPGILERVVDRACNLQALVGDEAVRKVVGGLQRLPTLPAVYVALQRTLRDERSGAPDVARIIQQDISMSAKVLQLVNSAFFGLGRRISTVQEAVSYLGFRMIQHVVLATEIFAGSGLDPRSGLSLEGLRDHAVLTAAIARRILGGDRKQAEDAWAAGLLHDVGKLVFATELPEHLATAAAAAREAQQPLFRAEQELFGVTHAEVGAYLLGVWGLPYSVVEAVAHHHVPERVRKPGLDAVTAVHVANALAHECERSGETVCNAALNFEYLALAGLADQVPHWRQSAQELNCAVGQEQA